MTTVNKKTKKKSDGTDGAPTPKDPPLSGKPLETYEKLIRAAGELLGEVGFEKLTTNAICAKAGLTPPALYRYFKDKYEVLEALARKLLQNQAEAFAAWMSAGERS